LGPFLGGPKTDPKNNISHVFVKPTTFIELINELNIKNTQKGQKGRFFTTPYNTLVLGSFLGSAKTDPNLAYFNKNYNLNNKIYKSLSKG
jgi:hypothetical protein